VLPLGAEEDEDDAPDDEEVKAVRAAGAHNARNARRACRPTLIALGAVCALSLAPLAASARAPGVQGRLSVRRAARDRGARQQPRARNAPQPVRAGAVRPGAARARGRVLWRVLHRGGAGGGGGGVRRALAPRVPAAVAGPRPRSAGRAHLARAASGPFPLGAAPGWRRRKGCGARHLALRLRVRERPAPQAGRAAAARQRALGAGPVRRLRAHARPTALPRLLVHRRAAGGAQAAGASLACVHA
jgi:hypothetical protein